MTEKNNKTFPKDEDMNIYKRNTEIPLVYVLSLSSNATHEL